MFGSSTGAIGPEPDTAMELELGPLPGVQSWNASAMMCELGRPEFGSGAGARPSGTSSSPGWLRSDSADGASGIRQRSGYSRGSLARAGRVAPSPVEIRQFCSTQLAAHKIPRVVVVADAIPLNSRGKTDRAALEALVRRHLERSP
jgi:hypothetical protein